LREPGEKAKFFSLCVPAVIPKAVNREWTPIHANKSLTQEPVRLTIPGYAILRVGANERSTMPMPRHDSMRAIDGQF
jgi:hypothetical protein